MAKIYGVARPQPIWGVVWEGDNIEEIQDAFSDWPSNLFFINEENGNLCYGLTIEEANQYPIGTVMLLQGGIGYMSQESWDSQYSTLDSATRLKYDVTEDAETVTSFTAKRSR